MNRKNVRMSKYVTGEGEAEARKGYTSHKANTFVFKDKSGQRKKKKKKTPNPKRNTFQNVHVKPSGLPEKTAFGGAAGRREGALSQSSAGSRQGFPSPGPGPGLPGAEP